MRESRSRIVSTTRSVNLAPMRKVKIYAILIAVLIAGIVIAQNTAVVETQVLFMTIAMPRAALLALTLTVGILIGLGIAFIFKRGKSKAEDE